MNKAYVQVYTGNGKGKTTAAAGLAVRAAGRNMSVKFVQFLKGRDTGEVFVLEKLDGIEVMRVSACTKFFHVMNDVEKQQMRAEVLDALPVIASWLGKADVVILDEALGALQNGILKQDEVCAIIDGRKSTEIVLTGRNAPDFVVERAHLVTEMKDVKHYMGAGVDARRGIEY